MTSKQKSGHYCGMMTNNLAWNIIRFGMSKEIKINPRTCGGIPVLRGTRIPVARILSEIAEDNKLSEIAADLDLNLGQLISLLNDLASHYNEK